MTERQLNLLQSIQDGIELARKDLSGPGSYAIMLDTIQTDIFSEEYKPMSAGRIADLACMMIAYRDAGSPGLD